MSELIFITGVSGYIGFQTMVLALEAGHAVRAAVRKQEQIAKLNSHKSVQPYVNQLTFVVIPDMADPQVVASNLKDVTGILHLASPLAVSTTDYEKDIVSPALQLTTSILAAASATPSVKRVIITSSAVTLIPFEWLSSPSDKTYTSSDLNTHPKTPYNSPMEAYWSSKALSRMAVHTHTLTHPTSHFTTIQLLPSVVIGPDLLATKSSDVLANTRGLAMSPILGTKIEAPLVGVPVHVGDVARAHVEALNPRVEGNRDYILNSDGPRGMEWNDGIAVAQREFPQAVEQGILNFGGGMPTQKWKIDSSATEEAFGWKCRSFEETIKDLISQYVEFAEAERV